MMAVVYAVICVFDFIVVPSWIGLNRRDLIAGFEQSLTGLDPSVQIEIVKSMSHQHQPFTLQGGGLFHLAFGALLTGSAITRKAGSHG